MEPSYLMVTTGHDPRFDNSALENFKTLGDVFDVTQNINGTIGYFADGRFRMLAGKYVDHFRGNNRFQSQTFEKFNTGVSLDPRIYSLLVKKYKEDPGFSCILFDSSTEEPEIILSDFYCYKIELTDSTIEMIDGLSINFKRAITND